MQIKKAAILFIFLLSFGKSPYAQSQKYNSPSLIKAEESGIQVLNSH